MTPLAERILFHAVAALGVHETAPNSGEYVDEYLKFVGLEPGNPWCAAALSLWAEKAKSDLGLHVILPRTGSSHVMALWFMKRKRLTGSPEPGMAGFLKGGPTGWRHTFVVETVGEFTVGSVDANEGNRVERASHSITGCSFGRWPE